jgi:CrcB protein
MPSLVSLMIVALGGALGSVFRYVLGSWAQAFSKGIFPYGTLVVNLLGCFVIGFLAQLVEVRGAFSLETRLLVFVGVLGGFTTFSSFGNETVKLLKAGETFHAWANVGANVIVGLLLVWLGQSVANWIWR